MKRTVIMLAQSATMLSLTLLLSSCNVSFNNGVDGNGNITTETRIADQDFSSIDVDNGIEVMVSQGDEKSITVKTDENLQRLITTRIENGVLRIEAAEGYDSSTTPTVTVRTPTITALSASGGSSISSVHSLITPKLAVESDSGSQISLSVEAEDLSLQTSSGSSIEARGKAIKLETSASSGSSIDAANLRANDIRAQSSSGSSTEVHPILSLDASASSGSSIDYSNQPKSLKKEENSGGSVSQN